MKKILKHVTFLLIIFSLLLASGNLIYAANEAPPSSQNSSLLMEAIEVMKLQTGNSIAVYNGKKTKLTLSPMNKDKQILAPAKYFVETLGGKQIWEPTKKMLTITRDSTKIVYTVKSKTAMVNGKKVSLTIAPVMIKGIPMIPVKQTCQFFGLAFSWNEKLKSAEIQIKFQFLNYPDPYFEAEIRKLIKKPTGKILVKDVSEEASLDIANPQVSNTDGIQYMKKLRLISISGTKISNLSPLASLKNLEYLYLSDNQIRDLSPLIGLVNLKELNLSGNPIKDASILSYLKNLKSITLWDSQSLDQILKINQRAKSIISTVIKPGMSDLEKELALHDYLITHSNYNKQNYNNHTLTKEDHDAYGILINGLGVCDGYAEAMQILLTMCDIECKVVIGDSIGPKDPGYEDYGHAWNMVKIDGNYYHLDLTFNDPVSTTEAEKDSFLHTYFNLSDDQIALNHSWDRNQYPKCTVDNDNFDFLLKENRDTIITENYIYKIFDENLYRFKPDGTEVEKICQDKLYYITISEGYIFYLNMDDNSNVYRIRLDGSGRERISKEYSLFPYADNQSLYYISRENGTLLKAGLDGSNPYSLGNHKVISYFNFYDGVLFYRGFDFSINSKLYRASPDMNQEAVVINEPLIGYEMSPNGRSVTYSYGTFEKMTKDFIYFISKNNGNRIYRVRYDGTELTQMNNLSSAELEIYGSWIYFVNNEDNKHYRVNIENKGESELLE